MRHARGSSSNWQHGLPVADNLLDRNFMPSAPNQAWTSDITDLWTDEGGLYLAIVLDWFDREVVGWSLKPQDEKPREAQLNELPLADWRTASPTELEQPTG